MVKSFQTGGRIPAHAGEFWGTPMRPTLKGRAYVSWLRLASDERTRADAFSAGWDAVQDELFDAEQRTLALATQLGDQQRRTGLADLAILNAPHAYDCEHKNDTWMPGDGPIEDSCICWKADYDKARREMRA